MDTMKDVKHNKGVAIRLPPDLHKKLKLYSVEVDKSINKIINEMLEKCLK